MNNYNYVYYDWPHRSKMEPTEMIYMNNNLFSPQEGFMKGNLFQNLYQPYKNYKPTTFRFNDEQEKKLFELQTIIFAMHELNLYLDTHPNNQSMIMLFQDYKRQKEKLCEEYEQKYGSITVGGGQKDNQTFEWISNNWPWEVKNV